MFVGFCKWSLFEVQYTTRDISDNTAQLQTQHFRKHKKIENTIFHFTFSYDISYFYTTLSVA